MVAVLVVLAGGLAYALTEVLREVSAFNRSLKAEHFWCDPSC